LLLNEPRANRYLESSGLDALISSSRENTSYLTNFLSVTHVQDRMYNVAPGSGENYMQTYGIFPRGGKPVLVIPAAMYMFSQFDEGITDQVYAYGRSLAIATGESKTQTASGPLRDIDTDAVFETPASALRAVVKEHVSGPRMGVDYSDLAPETVKGLSAGKTRLFNATELFRFIRLVKSPEEMRRLRRSAKINENGMSSMLDAAKSGASEIDLMKAYATAVVASGARFEVGNVMCPSGPRSCYMMRPSKRRMVEGDLVWIDVICFHDGYSSDTGETASIGRPDPGYVRVYDAMKGVIERAQDLARPEVRPSDLCKEVETIWDRAGLSRPPVSLGHGIGLETHEYPKLSHGNGGDVPAIRDDVIASPEDIPLEEGMVLNLESAYLVKGWGGVHLEKTVMVGKKKTIPIIEQERDLRIV
jgi:Xaa-Pro aminopeptidase